MPIQRDNINFIPDKLVNERRAKQTKMVGTRISIILLFVIAISSSGIFYYNYTVNQKIEKYEEDSKKMSDEIITLKVFGEEGYKLGYRLENIYRIMNNRVNGSGMMKEIMNRLPTGVEINDWNYNSSQGLVIKGSSKSTYVPIDLFKENLLNKGENGDLSPFTDVKLTNATYDKSDGLVSFSITVDIDTSKLIHQEPIEIVEIILEEQNEPSPEPEPTTGFGE